MEHESLSDATKRIFQSGMLLDTKTNLKNLLTSFAGFWYFCIAIDGCKFTCNRAGETDDWKLQEKDAKWTHKRDFKCNCQWVVRFRYVNACDRSGPMKITKICPNHTFPYESSSNQYSKAHKVSGELFQYT